MNPIRINPSFASVIIAGGKAFVAQTGSLLYRRVAFGQAPELSMAPDLATPCGFPIRDTAEFHSALQGQYSVSLQFVPNGLVRIHASRITHHVFTLNISTDL